MSQTLAQLIQGLSISGSAPAGSLNIDSSGRLLVGTSTTTGFQSGARHIFMDGGGAAYSSVSIGNPGGALNNTDINITAWTGGGSNYYSSKIRQIGDGALAFHTQASSSADGAGTTTERMRIDSAGLVGIGTTSPSSLLHLEGADGVSQIRLQRSGTSIYGIIRQTSAPYGLAYDAVDVNTGAPTHVFRTSVDGSTFSERIRIDSSGRLLVGASSTTSLASLTGLVQVEGTSTGTPGFSAWCDNNTAAFGAYLALGRARGTTIGSNTAVQNNDDLGRIYFFGANGTDRNNWAAEILCSVDGDPFSGGDTTDLPGRLVFSTTADGASSPTERMRINSVGNLFCQGVYDNTTSSAVNVFVNTNGNLARSTSSIKYKANVETLEDSYSDALLNCRPVWYQSTCAMDNPLWGHWGFIAEEVAEIDPRLCFFKEQEDGTLEPEGVQYDRFVPHLLNLIRRQNEQIKAMETRLTALETL